MMMIRFSANMLCGTLLLFLVIAGMNDLFGQPNNLVQFRFEAFKQLVIEKIDLTNAASEPVWPLLQNQKYQKVHDILRDLRNSNTKENDEKLLTLLLSAELYQRTGKTDSAKSCYLQAEQLAGLLEADTTQTLAAFALATMYQQETNLLKAAQYFDLARTTGQKIAVKKLVHASNYQLCVLYYQFRNPNKYAYHLEELFVPQQVPDFDPIQLERAYPLPLYFSRSDHDKIEFLENTWRVHQHSKDVAAQLMTIYQLNMLYEAVGYPQERVVALESGIQLIKETSYYSWLSYFHYELFSLSETAGLYQKALFHYQAYVQCDQQVYSAASDQIRQAFQNKVQDLELENLYQSQILETTKKTNQRNIILTLFIIFLVISLLVFRNIGDSNRNKQRISAQKAQIQTQRIKELEKNAQLMALNATISGQESERRRIAEDLHDDLGGLLTSVKLQFKFLEQEIGQIRVRETFRKTEELLDRACHEVRRIAHNMMPETLHELGLLAALEDLFDSIPSDSLHIDLQSFNFDMRLPEEIEIMVYRIIQEIITNVFKHALATKVIIQLSHYDEYLNVTVEDDGIGFDHHSPMHKGKGLISIKSRVAYLNGRLEVDSQFNVGTSIHISIPISLPQNKTESIDAMVNN